MPPKWLLRAGHDLLASAFQDAKPRHVYYIPYPKKIAVVFEFRRRVACGLCDSPVAQPRMARVIRVSFDRTTHQLSGASNGFAVQLCEVVGNQPPKSRCLRH
jgi:hypothetical protein